MARSKRKPMSDINVVPYIDVMLVLLIIFMVTAPMLAQGIKVDLPQIESDDQDMQVEQEPMIVSINANGAYFLDISSDSTRPLELSELMVKASEILKKNPSISVLVRGDREVAYGAVVELMAELQQAGASGVGLITEDL